MHAVAINNARIQTSLFVRADTASGHRIPDNVPSPLDRPMSIEAYLGAISK